MDLVHAARAVQAVPDAGHSSALRDLLWRAHVADKYVKRLGKLHPHWGDGSLRAAALLDLGNAEQPIITAEFLSSFASVARLLAEKYDAAAEQ